MAGLYLITGMHGSEVNFYAKFANSTLVALTVTSFQIITSALPGYTLARLKFRGATTLTVIHP